jgi:Uma2 family endonuclease
MGQITRHEALALRWAALCNDPLVRSLPGKIELNSLGVIEMSPASTRHARMQAAVVIELARCLPEGAVLTECPVFTSDGVRVPDVVWTTAAFFAKHGDATPLPQAPELCVEIRSPSNSDEEMELKTRLYLEAGALEVWIVSEEGVLQCFDAQGPRSATRYGIELKLPANPGLAT